MQGFNMGRYYPPSTNSPPTFNTGESLRAATRKNAATGTQTVRFEMPFHMWCDNCKVPTIIPQGVRFNAEKKKIGMYYSTAIWSFRMKHNACGGAVEIRTDPAAGEYVVVEGGRRRDYGDDKVDGLAASGEILTEEDRERRRNDAFSALEGRVDDKNRSKEERDRIADLKSWRERNWADPYEVSRKLRKEFREEKKSREKKEAQTKALKEKFGLEMDLVDENENDKIRAGLVDFGGAKVPNNVAWKPLFAEQDDQSINIISHGMKGKTKAQQGALMSKEKLTQELRGNTRAVMDPFLSEKPHSPLTRPLLGIKRKRIEATGSLVVPIQGFASQPSSDDIQSVPQQATTNPTSLGLSGYDSD